MFLLSAIFGGEAQTQVSVAPVGYSGATIHYIGKAGTEYYDTYPSELGLVSQIIWGQGPINLVTGLGVETVLPGVVILDCIVGARGTLLKQDWFSLSYFVLPQLGFSNGTSLGYGTGLAMGMKTYAEAAFEIFPNFSLFADLGLGFNLIQGGSSQSLATFLPLGFGMKFDFRRK